MKTVSALFLVFLLLGCSGCTMKFVTIDLDEGACIYIGRDVNPAFSRENTAETMTPDISLPLIPLP